MWWHLNRVLMLAFILMDKDATHVWGKVTEGRKYAEFITPTEETIEGQGRQLTKPILGLDATVERQGKTFRLSRECLYQHLENDYPMS